jgi:DNA-binding PadR family transcriptional regulator
LVGPCILLLLAETPSHGYELASRLRTLGYDWDGRPGPVYRELRILVDAGFVTCEASTSQSGPVPITCTLTPDGRAHLDAVAAALDGLTEFARHYAARYAQTCPDAHEGSPDGE